VNEGLKEAHTSTLHKALFEQAGIGIALTDQHGWIRLANRALCALLGYSDGDLEGKSFDELSHPDHRAAGEPPFRELVRCLCAGEISQQQAERQLVCKDGRTTWARLTLTALSNFHEAPGIVCVVEDITHHRQVELALQQEASYLNLLIESSGHAIVTISTSGDIQSWNAGAENLFGWRREEVIGRPYAAVCGSTTERDYQAIAQVIETAQPVHNHEAECRRRNGEPVSLMTTFSPILDPSGRVTGIVSIATDVSERNHLENEQIGRQRAEAILHEREMLARELHDNLSQDLSYVQMQVATIRELLAQHRASEADTMLSRLADVTQATQNDVREQIRNLYTRPAPRGFMQALRKYLAEFEELTHIQVDFRAPESVSSLDLAWEVELQFMRIIQEALSNVRKHARANKVTVDLTSEPRQLIAAISDDGQGFTQDALEDTAAGGKHFGLRIMQERAQEVGGSVAIQSTPGQGSRVTIRMPYNRSS
jgi:PAS domain S-box-containing protein